MSSCLRRYCVQLRSSVTQHVVFILLLIAGGLASCSDETKTSVFPVLDSTADTATWLSEMRTLSKDADNPDNQIRALNELGNYYSAGDFFDSAMHYYVQLRETSVANDRLHKEVVALEKMAGCYLAIQKKDSALKLMEEALTISTQADSISDMALAAQELGIFYHDERDSANALKYFRVQITYDSMLNDSSSLATCYSNIATVYWQNADYRHSITSYQKAIGIADSLGNDTALATYNLNLGIVFKEQGSYELALKRLLDAAVFFERIQSPRELSSCYNTMGNIYIETAQLNKAIEYYLLGLHLRDSIGYEKGIASSLTNLGQAHLSLGNYDTAISYLERSLVIKNQLGDPQFIATSLDLMGEAWFYKKDFSRADSLYKHALELKSEAGDPKSVAITLNKLGRLYYARGNNAEALQCLRTGRSKLESAGAKKDLMDNYRITADVFMTEGSPDSSLFYSNLHIAMKDSVMSEQKQRALTEMDVKYDTEKKEQEIALLNERTRANEAVVNRKDTLIYSLVGGAVLLIVVICLLVINAQSRRLALRQSEIIIEQKQTMMGELHHRIKNNLQVLSELLQLQQSRITDPEMAELIRAIDQRLTAMLLIHRGLYGAHVGSQVNMPGYIDALISNLCQSYGYSASELTIKKNIAPIELDADKALNLGFVCNEVMSNWFKHVIRKKGDAVLEIEFTGQKLRFSDNGPGFSNSSASEDKGSFGLRLIKLFSKQLNAELQLQSSAHGTTITLEIP